MNWRRLMQRNAFSPLFGLRPPARITPYRGDCAALPAPASRRVFVRAPAGPASARRRLPRSGIRASDARPRRCSVEIGVPAQSQQRHARGFRVGVAFITQGAGGTVIPAAIGAQARQQKLPALFDPPADFGRGLPLWSFAERQDSERSGRHPGSSSGNQGHPGFCFTGALRRADAPASETRSWNWPRLGKIQPRRLFILLRTDRSGGSRATSEVTQVVCSTAGLRTAIRRPAAGVPQPGIAAGRCRMFRPRASSERTVGSVQDGPGPIRPASVGVLGLEPDAVYQRVSSGAGAASIVTRIAPAITHNPPATTYCPCHCSPCCPHVSWQSSHRLMVCTRSLRKGQTSSKR